MEDQLASMPRRPSKAAKNALPNTIVHTLKAHRGSLLSVLFHAPSMSVITASEDCTIKIIDLETGSTTKTLKSHVKSVNSLCFAKDKLVSASTDNTIKVFDIESWSCTSTLYGHDNSVSSVRASESGDKIVSASRDASVKVWDIATSNCIATMQGHADWVRDAAFSHDDKLIVSCGSDRLIIVWNADTGDIVCELRGHDHLIEGVLFVPPRSIKHIKTLVPSIHISEDDYVIVSCSRDKTIRFWSVNSATGIYTIDKHENWVKSLAISPCGRYLVSGSDDKSLRVWDLESGRCVKTLEEVGYVNCVDWIDGYVAAGSDSLKIWTCE